MLIITLQINHTSGEVLGYIHIIQPFVKISASKGTNMGDYLKYIL